MKIYILILLSCFFGQNAIGQHTNINSDRQLKQAQAFERANMLSEASQIYIDIIKKDEQNIYALKRIKNIYKSTQDTLLIKKMIENYNYSNITNQILLIELMELNIWIENSNWERLSHKVFNNNNKQIITLLIGKLINNGLIDNGIAFINKYREKNDILDFYSLELGTYYSSRMSYEDALMQYLLYLQFNPKNYRTISNKIMQFPDIISIQNKIKQILNNSNVKNAKILLSDLEFKSGNFDVSYNLLLDNHVNPNELIEFAYQIFKLELYDKSIEIYSSIIDGEYSNKIKNDALMGIAKSLRSKSISPKYILPISSMNDKNSILSSPFYQIDEKLMKPIWDAITIYDSLSSNSNVALLELANIKFKGINDIDSAINIYRKLLNSNKTNQKIRLDSGLHLIEALIVKGNFNEARSIVDSLKKLFINKEAVELIKIKELQIKFFSGSFQESLEMSNKLLSNLSKNNLFYNDVLSIKSTILLFFDDKNIFTKYASIQLLIFQNKKIQALENLLIFVKNATPILIDVGLYEIANLSLYFDDIELSIKQLNQINTSSIYIEMSEILRAEIFDYIINNKEEAVNIYLNILNTYPNSINYDNVRFRLREIAS